VIPVDALVIATGTRPYLPTDFPAGTDLVITQDDLAARLAAGRADWNKIVMLQCVGARDAAHPYCSRFCCRQALANARLLKLANPGAQVTILHKGIRVFGFEEELLTDAEEQGIGLIEIADRPAVEAGSPLRVRGASAAGQAYSLESDVLVLSVGHARDEGAQRLAGLTGARIDGLGFFETSDPLIRPFATQAPGVFVCGFARAPVTLDEAFADGLGAAGAVCEYLKERPNRRS
jgi:heterodisulfide reductase subunit A-like polyferredoxin